ncbi:MAG: efflux RND transporter periplasmic adaptor subunit [Bacteroidales bacterium]|nr:efflux RND transporter periplasmic adaptor subunit [Bacteroidales bacterium]
MNYRFKLIAIFLAFLIISGCSNQQKSDTTRKEIAVKTIQINQQSVSEVLQFSGDILPLKTIKFGFMVAGKIENVYVKEGQYVKEGELIATIDPTDYEFAVQAAEAKFVEAENEFQRLTNLYKKGSLTESDFDKIQALYKEAQANVDYKKNQLKDTHLYAPHNGWLAVEGVQPGEIIPQGMPIFAIVYTKNIFIRSFIPENEIAFISMNMDVTVEVPALDNAIFEGKISRIGSVADPYSRAFPVKATIENTSFSMKPGMIAFLNVETPKKNKIIYIPAEAVLLSSDGRTYVYLLDKDGNKVTKRNIQTNKTHNKGVNVLNGLKNGDIIVTEGNTKLYEGAIVKISK